MGLPSMHKEEPSTREQAAACRNSHSPGRIDGQTETLWTQLSNECGDLKRGSQIEECRVLFFAAAWVPTMFHATQTT